MLFFAGKSDLEPTFSGCICIYSDSSSLEYIRSSLEKALLSNLEQEDRLPFQVKFFFPCWVMNDHYTYRFSEMGMSYLTTSQNCDEEVPMGLTGPQKSNFLFMDRYAV